METAVKCFNCCQSIDTGVAITLGEELFCTPCVDEYGTAVLTRLAFGQALLRRCEMSDAEQYAMMSAWRTAIFRRPGRLKLPDYIPRSPTSES